MRRHSGAPHAAKFTQAAQACLRGEPGIHNHKAREYGFRLSTFSLGRNDGRGKDRGRGYFASGSGRSWMCTARGLAPLPPSISHGVRSPLALHSPLPFQPAAASSMRPSRPLA